MRSSRRSRRTPRVERLAQHAKTYGIPASTVDGNDLFAVREAMQKAVEKCRAGKGPVFVECLTHRMRGHYEGDPAKYRELSQLAEWKKKDPIARVARALKRRRRLRITAWTIDAKPASSWKRPPSSPCLPPGPRQLSGQSSRHSNGVWRAGGCAFATYLNAMSEQTFLDAIRSGLAEELRRDSSVYVFGEDVALGGPFGVTKGLSEEFGANRLVNTPISEGTVMGLAIGAATAGLRPVVEIMFIDFITLAMDQLVNHAAKLHYMSGGQLKIPLTVRVQCGISGAMGAHHSQSLESWLAHVPGLKVVMPSNPADAKGLLKAAVRDDNPVVFIEHRGLYWTRGQCPTEINRAHRQGRGRATGRTSHHRRTGKMVGAALEAAEELAAKEISVEVIDPRTLSPLDIGTIVNRFRKPAACSLSTKPSSRAASEPKSWLGFSRRPSIIWTVRLCGSPRRSLRCPRSLIGRAVPHRARNSSLRRQSELCEINHLARLEPSPQVGGADDPRIDSDTHFTPLDAFADLHPKYSIKARGR